MTFQIWVYAQKKDVREIKVLLEKDGQLDKTQKIKSGEPDGYMLIPTNISHAHEVVDSSVQDKLISSLSLPQSQNQVASLLSLPSTSLTNSHPEVPTHPITSAISTWFTTLPEASKPSTTIIHASLLSNAPKRWSTYPPLLLLPSGTFQSPPWVSLLGSLPTETKDQLWRAILEAVWAKEGGLRLTHLAINAGIPSQTPSPSIRSSLPTSDKHGENILRSPSRLHPLYGDFGPEIPQESLGPGPTEQDFRNAFWVETKQNGVVQVWVPRWTMFSRGNVKEKARVLGFGSRGVEGKGREKKGEEEEDNKEGNETTDQVAVDFYAGIGYFAFSYAKLGLRPVLCWEINPWSVEGLRRGAERNGWAVRVVQGDDLRAPLWEILNTALDARLVVLEESNERAAPRMRDLRCWEKVRRKRVLGDVVHVNCGLLPSSEISWRAAWEVVRRDGDGWLHLHENVGVRDVERRRGEIEEMIRRWASDEGCGSRVEVEHVELVKTFAPGVWHCVFDVHIAPALQTTHDS